ncbi:heavy metal-associated isoprenylated plant protein 21-like [Olea europaea var. sylvestris]|uniref:Heavy metal-associated isoprenylated plant 20-like n=1 Tax=Olea europaea subsp. europaea TaxID=158383 RepID=A0A8S0PAF1_OLEEU|nr:heavy metal-associated isoprenylated plant protein 21-like [Olea europaea var. sylvestris]CAA2934655.1 heavy metal-associated isoprenylated plant 20-like [Olea europaea subsp. europaea]
MGFVDHISEVCSVTSTRKSKRKPMQTVEIRVKMDCDGCERRVGNAVSSIKGVKSVDINRKQSRVEPNKVLDKVKSTGKKAEFWPYVQYNLACYPYAPGAYDKKAPSGYVRNVAQAFPSPSAPVEKYTTIFSDENVNACSVM